MSWNLTIHVENGVAALQPVNFPPLDGSYTLAGHEDDGSLSLSAYMYDVDGAYKGSLAGCMRKPPPVILNNAVEEIATPEAESNPE